MEYNNLLLIIKLFEEYPKIINGLILPIGFSYYSYQEIKFPTKIDCIPCQHKRRSIEHWKKYLIYEANREKDLAINELFLKSIEDEIFAIETEMLNYNCITEMLNNNAKFIFPRDTIIEIHHKKMIIKHTSKN